LAFVTTVGQRHDAVAFELVLGNVFSCPVRPGDDPARRSLIANKPLRVFVGGRLNL